MTETRTTTCPHIDFTENQDGDRCCQACGLEVAAERPALTGLHIEGRRWFQRGPGNTYHSVRIYANGELLVYLPFAYGYGDGFLQTAIDWLRANGYPEAQYGTLYLREVLGGTYSVIDVTRKSDL